MRKAEPLAPGLQHVQRFKLGTEGKEMGARELRTQGLTARGREDRSQDPGAKSLSPASAGGSRVWRLPPSQLGWGAKVYSEAAASREGYVHPALPPGPRRPAPTLRRRSPARALPAELRGRTQPPPCRRSKPTRARVAQRLAALASGARRRDSLAHPTPRPQRGTSSLPFPRPKTPQP